MKPVLELESVSVDFALPRRRGEPRSLRAVREVSLRIEPEESLALVGESGSGKSTLARAALRLVPVASGRVTLAGQDITGLRGRQLRAARRRAQMVFQDPYSSLDPSMTIGDSIAEPLEVHHVVTPAGRRARVGELLETVGLLARHADRYPHEFSGGQRQRIAIARALAVEPDLLIADEAVSALDVSTQNQIVTLIATLRERLGMACLFISHDLALVRHVADRSAVMYLGRVVEEGPVHALFEDRAHPYTSALLSAIPVPDPLRQRERQRIRLVGEIPDPARPPSGCSFRTRCPSADALCAEVRPELRPLRGTAVACHHPLVALESSTTSTEPSGANPRRHPQPAPHPGGGLP